MTSPLTSPLTITYAILAAVSTLAQTEGDSLPEQERKCLAAAQAKGWTDTGLRYVIPGQSRTLYVNLRDAERAIPPLAAALNDAQAGRYQLLLLYDYNRLRDLADPVAKTLASYGVQLYSVNQPVEPLPPASFDPYAADSEGMMRGLNQIISKWQINDLRRKYRFGVRARVERGLYSLNFPYGYRHATPDKTSPLVLDPSVAALLLRLKDAFLAGSTLSRLASLANQSGVPPARAKQWRTDSIYVILRNPFYAGKTFLGKTTTHPDPRQARGRTLRHKTPALLKDGLHPKLWDWQTHLQILAEFDRRRKGDPRNKRRPLSGLLVCSLCGSKLNQRLKYFRCVKGGASHVSLSYDKAMTAVPRQLADALRRFTPDPQPGAPLPGAVLNEALADLERKRKRVTEGYEAGLYDLPAAKNKLADIDQASASLHAQTEARAQAQANRRQLLQTLADLQPLLDDLPAWFANDDPHRVNYLLHRLLASIIVTPDHLFTFNFNE